MKICFLTVIFLLFQTTAHALAEDNFLMRVSWVKSLKGLLQEVEKKDGDQLLTKNELEFLKRFSLLEKAWADSRYDCFYAGWPSTLVKSGGKRLCQSPSKGNTLYQTGSCSSNELQCQPLLFGKSLCVSFSSRKDKQMAFAKCEEKFQKEKKGDYEFLKKLSREEAQELKEISLLAVDICETGKKGVQKESGMCKNLLKKFPDGFKATSRAWLESFDSASASLDKANKPLPRLSPPPPEPHDEENCEEDHPHFKQVINEANALQKAASSSSDDLYEKLKRNFEASAFCDPDKIMNDPKDKPTPFLMGKLARDLYFIQYILKSDNPGSNNQLEKIIEDFGISSEVASEVRGIVRKLASQETTPSEVELLKPKAKLLLMKDFTQNYRPGALEGMLKEELVKQNVFTQDPQGKISCPFVGKDAFLKALAGREEVLKSHSGSIKKSQQITIVDYSRPSHERRMFVMDLENKEVLHNTWVAHGVGGGAQGIDGKGSSPQMSDRLGSNMSSDGFVIATQAASGRRFGPNVLLQGIDQDNGNMAKRAVILHGWASPMSDYTEGIQDFDYEKETFSAPKDPILELKRADLRSSNSKELEKTFSRLRSATFMNEFLEPTEGCLGVPKTSVSHLDKKGRNKSQLEVLREDLPGSLIFNYSGPDMKSSYF
jgi:hypothetical protein